MKFTLFSSNGSGAAIRRICGAYEFGATVRQPQAVQIKNEVGDNNFSQKRSRI